MLEPSSQLFARRYRFEALLGEGGTAAVYRARDEVEGRAVAIKRLRCGADPARNARLTSLFQREFHTLMHLAHPSIIEVYDYGHSDDGPFYTMELLGGEDLRTFAPVDWQEACRLLHDVASSLAIIHSRGLLHCDLSASNVRCTADGRAKLIDFGAMTTLGACQRAGTVPFISPEAVHGQPLDVRADMFGMGCLAYWVLTGRYPYEAYDLVELKKAWQKAPLPPSRLVDGLPGALDDLVLSLLKLNALGRPSSAADVLERLGAIAQLPPEQLDIAQAYLTTPTLTGRDEQILSFRSHLSRATRGRGSVIWVRGESGMGRTRLLQAFGLEAKLLGIPELQLDGRSVRTSGGGVVGTLARELARALGEAPIEEPTEDEERLLSALCSDVYELTIRHGRDEPGETGADGGAEARQALSSWLQAWARKRAIVIAVDDVHLCDEQCLGFLCGLTQDLADSKAILLFTSNEDTSAPALDKLAAAGVQQQLSPLGPESTHYLLGSVFGDVPNLAVVADWIYHRCAGQPRACMELAQYLVDRDVARYEGGAWVLPDRLREADVPSGLDELLAARIASLGHNARTLAEGLALAGNARLKLHECPELLDAGEHTVAAALFEAVDELATKRMLAPGRDDPVLAFRGLVDALRSTLCSQRASIMHARLARIFEQRPDRPVYPLAYHWMHGGQPERAVSALVDEAQRISTGGKLPVNSDPREFLTLINQAIDECHHQGRPPYDARLLRLAAVSLSVLYKPADTWSHGARLFADLKRDLGVGGDQHPADMKRWVQIREQEYAKTPEPERGLSPEGALRGMVSSAICVMGAAAKLYEPRMVRSLLEELAPLRAHPSIAAAHLMAERMRLGLCGRVVSEPATNEDDAQAVLYESRGVRLSTYTMRGLRASSFGGDHAFIWADKLEGEPGYEDRPWRIRMLAHLFNGRIQEAERCRQRTEQLEMHNAASGTYSNESYAGEMLRLEGRAHAMAGDLLRLKHALERFRRLSLRYRGWTAFADTMEGEYRRQRGELYQAEQALERALSHSEPGEHRAWQDAITPYARTLAETGRLEQAQQVAAAALETITRLDLEPSSARAIACALAEVEATLREPQAKQSVHTLLERAQADQLGGLPLGTIYETQAHVALALDDGAEFLTAMAHIADLYVPSEHPALIAKYDRLIELGRASTLPVDPGAVQQLSLIPRRASASVIPTEDET